MIAKYKKLKNVYALIKFYRDTEFPTSKYTWKIDRRNENGVEAIKAIVSNKETKEVVLTIEGGKQKNGEHLFLKVDLYGKNV